MYAQGGQKEQAMKYGAEAKRLYANRFGEDHEQTKHANQLHDSITRSIEAQIKSDEERSVRLAKRLGLDPKRAASLRARLLASSAPVISAHPLPQGPNTVQITAREPLSQKVRPPGQQGSPVSIDDLVKYIQGSTSTKSSKALNNPATSSSSTSARASSRHSSATKNS